GKTLWVLATGQTQPLPGEQPKDRAQTAIRTFAPHPKAHLLDELVDRAVRTNHEERPAMSAFAAELRAWLTQISAPATPGDLSDILAEINTVLEPSLRTERVRKSYIESAARAMEVLVERLQPIAQVFARIPGFDNALSMEDVSLVSEPADG